MYNTTFDFRKPTVQMLGRFQPWNDGHTELFKKALTLTGQVVIMAREVYRYEGDAGAGRTYDQSDNPFGEIAVIDSINTALSKEGYYDGEHYIIMCVPNIVDISYGRNVGCTFTEHNLGEEIHSISSSKIRKKMREEGKL